VVLLAASEGLVMLAVRTRSTPSLYEPLACGLYLLNQGLHQYLSSYPFPVPLSCCYLMGIDLSLCLSAVWQSRKNVLATILEL
jgi:hypothetical protein